MQTWEDGQHPLPEGPGGLHAQEARGCHQKGWQHIQVLVTMLFNNFFNFICSINVKTNMCGQFLLRRLYATFVTTVESFERRKRIFRVKKERFCR